MKYPGGYTFENYRHDMPPRAFGAETEFTTSHSLEDTLAHSGNLQDYIDPYNFVSPGRDDVSAVVRTGGEIYHDYKPLEYATPECRTPQELVLHTRAGAQLVDDLSSELAKRWGETGTVYTRAGYDRVVKNQQVLIKEDSVGHHENYSSINLFSMLPTSSHDIELGRCIEARYLADFLMLRKLIDGIGMVSEQGFSISQKPTAIGYRTFSGSGGKGFKRPFSHKPGRIEIRTGEGNKSDSAAEFKVSLTSLVLRLIEHGTYPKHLLLREPRVDALALAMDPFTEVQMMYSEPMRGIDVLREIVDEAMLLNQKFPDAPKYETKAGHDFYTYYDKLHDINLKENDVRALSDGRYVDWAARFEYLVERGASYERMTTRDLDQVRDDLKWDAIGQRDIARRRYRKFGHTALYVPIPEPPTTRAAARTAIARQLFNEGNLDKVYWNTIVPKNGALYRFSDVLSGEYVRLENVLSRPNPYFSVDLD